MNNDFYNFTLEVDGDNDYQLHADNDADYAMALQDAVNVVISQGAYYDTTAAWNMQPDLIAERGGIYVYSDKATIYDAVGNPTLVPGIKIGDGTSYLIDMPFVGDEIIYALMQHVSNNVRHITAEERTFWNNKVSSYLDAHDSENLILSKIDYVED